jgi:hypothetical protein
MKKPQATKSQVVKYFVDAQGKVKETLLSTFYSRVGMDRVQATAQARWLSATDDKAVYAVESFNYTANRWADLVIYNMGKIDTENQPSQKSNLEYGDFMLDTCQICGRDEHKNACRC